MLKKNIYFIFLISAFSLFSYTISAMEEPTAKNPKITSDEMPNNFEAIDIAQHFNFLERNREELEFNDSMLTKYKELINQMSAMSHPELNSILFIIHTHCQAYFELGDCILLKDINTLLSLLIRLFDNKAENTFYAIASEEEREAIGRQTLAISQDAYISEIYNKHLNRFLEMLIRNNLLPRLDHDMEDGIPFLVILLNPAINLNLFSKILNKVKTDKDSFSSITAMLNQGKETVFSIIKERGSQDHLKIIELTFGSLRERCARCILANEISTDDLCQDLQEYLMSILVNGYVMD